jgi:Flp pilus assembly protein TadD
MRDDEELAKELDEWNEAVKHMMRLVDYERTRTFMQMTPYEGLRLALRRADFAEARRYGAIVLQMDPEDPEANFGTGMAYLMEEKLKEAEMYLERTLVKRPDEPAVLNNLSIIYRKTNRLEKALEYVKKAHELLPANDEISRTLRDTERAMEKRTSTLKSAFEK